MSFSIRSGHLSWLCIRCDLAEASAREMNHHYSCDIFRNKASLEMENLLEISAREYLHSCVDLFCKRGILLWIMETKAQGCETRLQIIQWMVEVVRPDFPSHDVQAVFSYVSQTLVDSVKRFPGKFKRSRWSSLSSIERTGWNTWRRACVCFAKVQRTRPSIEARSRHNRLSVGTTP